MNPVNIIGMGMGPQDLTARHLTLIEQADVLVGGKRILDFFKDSKAQKKSITKDIDAVIKFVRNKMKTHHVDVLASGYPLFYGIGATLAQTLGTDKVVIHPNVSTVAAAFARIKEPWSDVHIVSLHGKKNKQKLLDVLEKGDCIAVLTDPRQNPTWLAQLLLEKNYCDFQICVLENLGAASERFKWYSLRQAAEMEYKSPNLVVLKRGAKKSEIKKQVHLGMPDGWFAHRAGLITKSEVRAVCLSKLQLLPNHTMWDLGAGSGSVSIEASAILKKGRIFALEKNPQRIELIKENIQRFKVQNLKVKKAILPQGLDKLPAPDRVFIGGGGKDLGRIIKAAATVLKEKGIIVINTVLIPSLEIASKTLDQIGFESEIIQVQINRGSEMPWGQRFEGQNPVLIVCGMRKSECGMGK
ncbi:MAG: precorrin-6y C5,15-methyltransferase (decarboxylating) subunit CbiE [Deltaproteobacteria bacterium]|jgi:precorrin-6Y C5,15-methyltransferase (decarboxylating)|nr:precorrin-6y C5,15-methyltransferase (decarboxylating) subunit CbiE [Deltaproteobacteria bacterium]